MTRVTQSSSGVLGFRIISPSHFPATLLKSVAGVACHWRVSRGAMELQATMRFTAAIMITIFKLLLSLVISFSKSLPVVAPNKLSLFFTLCIITLVRVQVVLRQLLH